MLSLKDFKNVKIEDNLSLRQITGGISCEEFQYIMRYLDKHNPEQAQHIRDTYEPSGWSGFQCD